MSILDRLFKPKEFKQPRTPYILNYNQAEPPSRNLAGFLECYSQVGWLFAVVSRIAEGVSEGKWRLYSVNVKGERTLVYKHPIINLMDFVNPFQTCQEFIELHQLYMGLTGECFWVINKNRLGEPQEMWIAPPEKMSVIPSQKEFVAGYIYQIGNQKIPLTKEEVIHHKLPNPSNPYRGLGPVQALAVDLDSELYSGKWNRNFFYNSARPDGLITFDGTLSEEQFDRLKKQWAERHEGVSRAHKIALLEGGGKYQQIAINAKDMDFKSLRLLNRDNILGAYGMPLSVMGITENVNKANAEAGEYTFARWLVKPRLNRIKNKLNEQLIPMFHNAQNLELDFDEVVPQTTEQKISQAESGMRAGYITINEARQLQGWDPKPSGEVFLIPLNLIPTPADKKIEIAPKEQPKSKSLPEGWKLTYWEATLKSVDQRKKLLEEAARKHWQEQEEEVIDNLGEPQGELFDKEKSKKGWSLLLIPALIAIYELSARDTDRLLNPNLPLYNITPDAESWILNHAGELINRPDGMGLDDVTMFDLRRTLNEGLQNGEDIADLTKRVKEIFKGYEDWRAERIARTETLKASNKAATDRYRAAGIKQWEWITGPNPCKEQCEELKGQIFNVGDEEPPKHPNCVCATAPVI